jgi:hypothetical protein
MTQRFGTCLGATLSGASPNVAPAFTSTQVPPNQSVLCTHLSIFPSTLYSSLLFLLNRASHRHPPIGSLISQLKKETPNTSECLHTSRTAVEGTG